MYVREGLVVVHTIREGAVREEFCHYCLVIENLLPSLIATTRREERMGCYDIGLRHIMQADLNRR